jgi:hypothetical protein
MWLKRQWPRPDMRGVPVRVWLSGIALVALMLLGLSTLVENPLAAVQAQLSGLSGYAPRAIEFNATTSGPERRGLLLLREIDRSATFDAVGLTDGTPDTRYVLLAVDAAGAATDIGAGTSDVEGRLAFEVTAPRPLGDYDRFDLVAIHATGTRLTVMTASN